MMTGPDLTALHREDATDDERVAAYQHVIDTGDAWRLEGHVGRTAVALIEAGLCMLGPVRHHDAYGNVVPSRFDIEPGAPGSEQYVRGRATTSE